MLLMIHKVSSRLAKWKTVYGISGMMGPVDSEWSEPHSFIRQCKYVYKKAADAKEYVLSSQSRIPLLDKVILPNKGMWL